MRPIADYGLLGDTRTAALSSSDGSLDWFCVPRFDGEPVFGSLVGGAAAGRFRLAPAGEASVVERRYRGNSATLEITWATPRGRLTLTEGMVAEVAGRLLPATILVRRLSVEGAPAEALVEFDPRLGEHHAAPRVRRRGEDLVCEWGALAMSLSCDAGPVVEVGRPTPFTVTPARPVTFVVTVAHREPLIHVDPATAWNLLAEDEERWRAWAAGIDPDMPFREAVVRSLLTLRLLTYSPSGAPVAAPTTSLPEQCGGGPQLGLPVRLAARCEHRHRGFPSSWTGRRGTWIPVVAAARQPAAAPAPAGAAHLARSLPIGGTQPA